jgi:hypothetical protein
MKIYASGDAQRLSAPGEFLASNTVGQVVGLIDLDRNSDGNEFGWRGLKAVIEVEGKEYVLDFPEFTRLVTDDGIELAQAAGCDPLSWWPQHSDVQRYRLRMIELTG